MRLPAQEVPFTQVELSGKFTQGQVGQLGMHTPERNWVVVLDSREHLTALRKPATTLRFKGEGRASILAAKMYIRLTATVDPKTGKATEPIRHVTWFTPAHETQYGAKPADVALRPDIREEPRRDGDAPPRRDAEPAADGGPREFYVVGWIEKLRNGQMTIGFNEKGGRIEAELAPDAVVEIDIDNKDVVYRLIQPGDLLQVSGIYREAGRVFAGEVVVRREAIIGEELPRGEVAALPRDGVGVGVGVGVGQPVAPVPPAAVEPDAVEPDAIPPGGAFAPPQPPPASEKPRIRILKIN